MKRAWRIIQVFIFTLVIVSSAHAELQGRMETPPGSGVYEAYYDTELEITWTTNAHLSGQSWTFDDANSWAAGLMFHGTVGWRLPNINTNGDSTFIERTCPSAEACLDNEFAYHRYINGIDPVHGAPGPFLWPPVYATFWTMNGWGSLIGWDFDFANGYTARSYRSNHRYAWAVHDGDVFVDDLDGDGLYPELDNCPEHYNPYQEDADSDGGGDLCDCDSGDAGVIAAPKEVGGWTFVGKTTTIIAWEDQAGTAGSTTLYDLVTGSLYDLHADAGFASIQCLAFDLPTPSHTDSRPLTGWNGFYYLGRAHNSCGISTHGAGREDLDAMPPCP